MFPYNTNVWASLGSRHMRKGPPVGVLPWDHDLAAGFFVPEEQGWGMGKRPCDSIPAQRKVLHRCR